MKKITLSFIFIFSIYQLQAQKLVFFYDVAGNQTQRFFCQDENNCNPPPAPSKIATKEDVVDKDELFSIENKFTVYPNPTEGEVSIKWENSVKDLIQKIDIVGYHTPYNKEVSFNRENLETTIDLSREMNSIYIVQFILTDQVITKKIIKN